MCKLTEELLENAKTLETLIIDTVKENKHLNEKDKFSSVVVESSDDIIYVTDIETNKILFINENTKKVFGDVVGQICYESFQNETTPCHFCTNEIILKQIGKPHKWVFYNEKVKKLYYIVDVAKEINGRLLRFERAINLNGEAKTIVRLFNKHIR